MSIFESIRRISVISLNEFKQSRSFTKKKIVVLLSILAVIIYALSTFLISSGFSITEPFYTVYSDNGYIRALVQDEDKFVIKENSNVDLYVEISNKINLYPANTDRGSAASYLFIETLKKYNKKLSLDYPLEIAYPIRVNSEELNREDLSFESYIEDTADYSSDAVTVDSTEDMKYTSEHGNEAPEELFVENEVLDNIENSNNDIIDSDLTSNVDKSINLNELPSEIAANELTNTPENLNPFDQMKTLFIVIFLTVPLSMISFVFSNSVMKEKVNKRGIYYLVSPTKPYEIIIGKMIPYLISAYIVAIPVFYKNVIGWKNFLGASAILLVIILIYFAISFVCVMLARTHKELSFLSVFFISMYSCYILVPSFMVNISFISLASPLTVIVKIFQNDLISAKLYMFSIVPNLLVAFIIFYFGLKLFNDENLFSYKLLVDKFRYSLNEILTYPWKIALITFFTVPLVFMIELMLILFLMSFQNFLAAFFMIIVAAFIEECFRNSGIYIMLTRKEKASSLDVVKYGLLSGVGFFLGEKVLLLVMIAPFVEAYLTLIFAGIVMPLLLHSALSVVFGFIIQKKGKEYFGVALAITTMLHFLINLTIFLLGTK